MKILKAVYCWLQQVCLFVMKYLYRPECHPENSGGVLYFQVSHKNSDDWGNWLITAVLQTKICIQLLVVRKVSKLFALLLMFSQLDSVLAS